MRIDAHVHGSVTGFNGDPDAYIEACRNRGVEGVVLIEHLEMCLEAMATFGDFIIPVARIPMNTATPSDVDACLASGCLGIKFIRPAAPYADPRYWPLYERIEAAGAVAVFHTGYLAFHEREDPPVQMEHMRAAQVEAVARRFPDLKILMAHFSNPWWEEAWKVSLSTPNVYADLSGGTAILRATRMWAEMFAPNGQLLEASVRKLCFASDVHYFQPHTFAFERYIAFYERIFDAIALPDELRERVNRGNIQALFNL
jgi:predicted TIM-barrel fold metal-dependent hydrolase